MYNDYTISELMEYLDGLMTIKEYNKLTFGQKIELLDFILDLEHVIKNIHNVLQLDIGDVYEAGLE